MLSAAWQIKLIGFGNENRLCQGTEPRPVRDKRRSDKGLRLKTVASQTWNPATNHVAVQFGSHCALTSPSETEYRPIQDDFFQR